MISFTVNGDRVDFDGDDDTPLLWLLRDHAGLTGTKFGCGAGVCGACTVHVDGEAAVSCRLTARAIDGRQVTTIEGLAGDDGRLHPVQAAWLELDVAQCGYCQAGQIMAASALLERNADPTDHEINAGLAGNLCRCGTYVRIRKAVRRAAEIANGEAVDDNA